MTLASNLLHTSHQNISKALKQLEDELGVELLLRMKQGILLTEKGTEVYNFSKQILELKKGIFKTIAPLSVRPSTDILHILLTPAFYGSFLTVMEKFRETHPTLNYFSEAKEAMYVNNVLFQGNISPEIIFTIMEDNIFIEHQVELENNFDIFLIRQEPLALLAKKGARKEKNIISLKELEQIPLVFFKESLDYDNFFLNSLVKHGFKSKNISISGISEFCVSALEAGIMGVIGTEFSYINSSANASNNNIKITSIYPEITMNHIIFVKKDASIIANEFIEFYKEVYEIICL